MTYDDHEAFLCNKRILLIAPVFFGYYEKIIEEISLAGGVVDYISDAPSNSNISKALGRINRRFIAIKTQNYFKKEVTPCITNNEYDFVLVIAGMTFAFASNMIREIRKTQKKARFVIYAWDSTKNLPFFKTIEPFFDFVFSFDREDAINNSNYNFLPLFYSREYEKVGEIINCNFDYDCSYVGTAHPKKYKDINNMSVSLIRYMPRQYIYHYMPSKLKFYYHKFTANEYKNVKLSNLKMEKISSNEMMNIFSKSRCILDAPQEGQTGLTMRSIECLGAKRKLITTNKDIVNYDFYCPENILVFDDNWEKNTVFFNSEYKEINKYTYYKYSLRNWLKTVFNCKG